MYPPARNYKMFSWGKTNWADSRHHKNSFLIKNNNNFDYSIEFVCYTMGFKSQSNACWSYKWGWPCPKRVFPHRFRHVCFILVSSTCSHVRVCSFCYNFLEVSTTPRGLHRSVVITWPRYGISVMWFQVAVHGGRSIPSKLQLLMKAVSQYCKWPCADNFWPKLLFPRWMMNLRG